MNQIEIDTTRAIEAIDVTELVAGMADGSGLLWLRTPHTTAAVVVNEADDSLLRDFERTAARMLDPLQPFEHRRNDNPNAGAHIAASIFGRECLLETADGCLRLGKHQRVLFIELDGPKRRTLQGSELGIQGGQR